MVAATIESDEADANAGADNNVDDDAKDAKDAEEEEEGEDDEEKDGREAGDEDER